jgi:hypothetical protein
MKTHELRQILRKIIKEEVAAEVSRAMGKILVEMVKEIKTGGQPTIISDGGRKDYIGREVEIDEDVTPDGPVLQTKNPKLNGVLAETARHFKPNQKTMDAAVGLADLLEGGFDKIGQNESLGVSEPPATKLDFLKQMVGAPGPAVMNQPSALDGGAGVPDVLKKVFKKDFRAVMKRIDEQKNGTASGGYIDPSKVIMNG